MKNLKRCIAKPILCIALAVSLPGCDATLGVSAVAVLAGALGSASKDNKCTPVAPINLRASASRTESLTDQAVTFSAEAQDLCKLPLSFSWKIDGETVSDTSRVDTAFDRPGTYRIEVSVENTAGLNSTASLTHVVTWAPLSTQWLTRIGMENEHSQSTETKGNSVGGSDTTGYFVTGQSGCGGCHTPEKRGKLGDQQALGNNAYLAKYTPTGDLSWLRLIGIVPDKFQDQTARTLAVSTSGKVTVAGDYQGSNSAFASRAASRRRDGFVEQFNQSGDLEWSQVISGTSDESIEQVIADEGGSIFVLGNTNGSLEGQTSNGKYDFFLSHLSNDGEKLSTYLIGGAGDDFGKTMKSDGKGNLYIAGTTKSKDLFGLQEKSDFDIFVSKISTSGSILWTKILGGTSDDDGLSLILDLASENLYISGSTFDNGSKEGYLAKLDFDGSLVWEKLIRGPRAETINSIALAKNGGVVALGTSNSNAIDEQSSLLEKDKIFITRFLSDGLRAPISLISSEDGDEVASAIWATTDGGYLVTGSSKSTVLLDVARVTNAGADAILLKVTF